MYDDVAASEYVDEDPGNNVVLVFSNSAVCSTRERLYAALDDPELLFYECRAVSDIAGEPNKERLYVRLQSTKQNVVVEATELGDALRTRSAIFDIHSTDEVLQRTGGKATIDRAEHMSGDHCQEGTDKRLFTLVPRAGTEVDAPLYVPPPPQRGGDGPNMVHFKFASEGARGRLYVALQVGDALTPVCTLDTTLAGHVVKVEREGETPGLHVYATVSQRGKQEERVVMSLRLDKDDEGDTTYKLIVTAPSVVLLPLPPDVGKAVYKWLRASVTTSATAVARVKWHTLELELDDDESSVEAILTLAVKLSNGYRAGQQQRVLGLVAGTHEPGRTLPTVTLTDDGMRAEVPWGTHSAAPRRGERGSCVLHLHANTNRARGAMATFKAVCDARAAIADAPAVPYGANTATEPRFRMTMTFLSTDAACTLWISGPRGTFFKYALQFHSAREIHVEGRAHGGRPTLRVHGRRTYSREPDSERVLSLQKQKRDWRLRSPDGVELMLPPDIGQAFSDFLETGAAANVTHHYEQDTRGGAVFFMDIRRLEEVEDSKMSLRVEVPEEGGSWTLSVVEITAATVSGDFPGVARVKTTGGVPALVLSTDILDRDADTVHLVVTTTVADTDAYAANAAVFHTAADYVNGAHRDLLAALGRSA